MRRQLGARDPANTEWQRDLSISRNKLGRRAGRPGRSAVLPWRRSTARLDHRRPLGGARPRQHRVAARSLDQLRAGSGDVRVAQGDLPGALAGVSRRVSTIADRSAPRDPANAEWQRDLSVSRDKLGDVRRRPGRAARRAGGASTASLAIRASSRRARSRQRRVAARPLNQPQQARGRAGSPRATYLLPWKRSRRVSPSLSAWRRAIPPTPSGSAVSQSATTGSGNVRVAQGDLPAAREAFEASLAIAVRLAARDPAEHRAGSATSQSATTSSGRSGRPGRLPAAREAFEASLGIRERLAARDASNVQLATRPGGAVLQARQTPGNVGPGTARSAPEGAHNSRGARRVRSAFPQPGLARMVHGAASRTR